MPIVFFFLFFFSRKFSLFLSQFSILFLLFFGLFFPLFFFFFFEICPSFGLFASRLRPVARRETPFTFLVYFIISIWLVVFFFCRPFVFSPTCPIELTGSQWQTVRSARKPCFDKIRVFFFFWTRDRPSERPCHFFFTNGTVCVCIYIFFLNYLLYCSFYVFSVTFFHRVIRRALFIEPESMPAVYTQVWNHINAHIIW